jgi:hypothetical protein
MISFKSPENVQGNVIAVLGRLKARAPLGIFKGAGERVKYVYRRAFKPFKNILRIALNFCVSIFRET